MTVEISDLVSTLDELQLLLDSLNQENPESLLYGLRDRYEQFKERAKSIITSLRGKLSEFLKQLTDTSSASMPDWVYAASDGALQSILDYLEDQYVSDNAHGQKVALGMVREAVNALRDRIRAAERASEEKRKVEVIKKLEETDKDSNNNADLVEKPSTSEPEKPQNNQPEIKIE